MRLNLPRTVSGFVPGTTSLLTFALKVLCQILFLTLFTVLPRSVSSQDAEKIGDILTPALDVRDVKLITILRDLDDYLRKNHPDHPNLPLVIDRHPNAPGDFGETKITAKLPKQPLPERLRILAGLSLTHWTMSDNDIVIFKTWHLGNFDPSPIFPETGSEQDSAGQPEKRRVSIDSRVQNP